jgi:hypothetical protein
MRRLAYLVIGAALFMGTAASAHHSYSATYNQAGEVKLDGKLVQFVYRNPHSFVHVETQDPKGAKQRWAVEWSGTGQLAEAGVQRDTLKVGDHVLITGRPSRVPGEFRVLMVTLQRPSDGFRWGGRGGQVVD